MRSELRGRAGTHTINTPSVHHQTPDQASRAARPIPLVRPTSPKAAEGAREE